MRVAAALLFRRFLQQDDALRAVFPGRHGCRASRIAAAYNDDVVHKASHLNEGSARGWHANRVAEHGRYFAAAPGAKRNEFVYSFGRDQPLFRGVAPVVRSKEITPWPTSACSTSSTKETRLAPYIDKCLRNRAPDPAFHAIMGHNVELCEAMFVAWDTLFNTGSIDHKLKEVIRVQLSRMAACTY